APAGGPLRYLHIHLSAHRWHCDRCPQGGFPRRNGHGNQHIPALNTEVRVGRQFHFDKQIARLPATNAGRALAFEPDVLPFPHSCGNFYFQGFLAWYQAPLFIRFMNHERHLFLAAVEGLFKKQGQPGMDIFASHFHALAKTATKASTPAAAEDFLKKITELTSVGLCVSSTAKAGGALPARRRLE